MPKPREETSSWWSSTHIQPEEDVLKNEETMPLDGKVGSPMDEGNKAVAHEGSDQDGDPDA